MPRVPRLRAFRDIALILFLSSTVSCPAKAGNAYVILDMINVKNFHGSLTTVIKAQNDTSKTANIADTIFDRTLV